MGQNKPMLILFVRAIILYFLVFMVIRLTGKRQISDLQPFDLIITLLVADLASVPASDTSIPLLYGIVPILALFLVQQLMAFCSLKFEGFRCAVCGRPLLMVSDGVVQESSLRAARYTLNDLMEQLRGGGNFDLAAVEYAILETNGQLSVLLKSQLQPATCQALSLKTQRAALPLMLVQDGRLHKDELRRAGRDKKWLDGKLRSAGIEGEEELLFAFISGETLHIQTKQRYGGRVKMIDLSGGKKK